MELFSRFETALVYENKKPCDIITRIDLMITWLDPRNVAKRFDCSFMTAKRHLDALAIHAGQSLIQQREPVMTIRFIKRQPMLRVVPYQPLGLCSNQQSNTKCLARLYCSLREGTIWNGLFRLAYLRLTR